MYLEEGDIAEITPESVLIKNHGEIVERAINQVSDKQVDSDKGEFKHYMLKEIYEQPLVIKETLSAYMQEGEILKGAFSEIDEALLSECQAVTIIACGTSFHAGLVAKYWIEEFVKMPCQVEIASEFRYRKVVVPKNSLLITISQSGETADTLAALRYGKSLGFKKSLAICNVEHSSLVRESDLFLLTYAGREIGVASTKAFTTQLTLLLMLTGFLAQKKGEAIDATQWHEILLSLPTYMEELLELAKGIEATSEAFQDKFHALFLGRGAMYPIAMEGALKLKEISYIHAESYAAGELKHGPLALVDATMPVVAIAPTDELLEKLKSNLEEVQARGGHLFVFTDSESFVASKSTTLIKMPKVPSLLAPIVYTLPLQLLSYYVALLKGTDVDQPRNLAKSVTVE
jgi:glucosamine--fructose-6-phosphate aminotransferase (isomerizing)